jgi:hypothetical protein
LRERLDRISVLKIRGAPNRLPQSHVAIVDWKLNADSETPPASSSSPTPASEIRIIEFVASHANLAVQNPRVVTGRSDERPVSGREAMAKCVIDGVLDEVRLIEILQVKGHRSLQLIPQRFEDDIVIRKLSR